jgi:hypothetical protein
LSQTIISEDAPHSYSHVPALTRENYPKWQLSVKAYLTPGDHVRVIRRTKDTSGNLLDPVALINVIELEKWNWSEWRTLGVIMGTATDLHYKLLSKHKHGGVWPLWKAIKAQHISHDASLHHKAWMQLFSICKRHEEAYLNLYRHVNNACSRIDHIMPANQSMEDCSDEITLFTLLSMLPADNPLRCQLVSQKGVTLNDAYSTFLRTNRDTAVASKVESASAAFFPHCHRCEQPGHFARDCPHFEAITRLVGQCISVSTGNGGNGGNSSSNNFGNNGGGRCRGRGCGSNAANTNATSTSTTVSTTSTTMPMSTTQETAGVATIFLSHGLCAADDWLRDSGASSSMSGARSAFLSLKSDWCLICLADGKVIYSEGLGSI